MFTFEAVMRKRARDYDSDSDREDEPYVKKSRSEFILNTSLSVKPVAPLLHLPHPSTTPSPSSIPTEIEVLTPAQSPSDAMHLFNYNHQDFVNQSSQTQYVDYSMDMDDDDCDVRSQPPESPAFSSVNHLFIRPAKLNSSSFTSDAAMSGRIPTPIHPNFKRGSMNGLGYPTSGFAGSLSPNMCSSSIMSPGISPKTVIRPYHEEDRGRRHPSPITEDDDLPDTPTALTQSQLAQLSFEQQGHDEMETDTPSQTSPVPTRPRGRKRSGALMGRFSMGYREDCEKCRQRVPGHYSHFIS